MLGVGPPGEEPRHGGIRGELEQPRRVLGGGVAQRQRGAADDERRIDGAHRPDAISARVQALLYDVHGNLQALDAVLADARAAGRRALGAGRRLRAVRRLARRDGRAAARARARRSGSAATASAGRPTPMPRPTTRSCRGPSPRPARRSAPTLVDDLASLPFSLHRRRDARLPRLAAQRRQVVRAGAGRRRGGAARRHRRPRGSCSGTPTCRSRAAPPCAGLELVNPGSVGMPFDGDTRAAYAHGPRRRVDRAPAGRVRPRRQRRAGCALSGRSGPTSWRSGSSAPRWTSRRPSGSPARRRPRRTAGTPGGDPAASRSNGPAGARGAARASPAPRG